MVDIPLTRYAKRGLSVSTISSQFWCEKAVELSFLHPQKPTQEMALGKARHDELHREVAELLRVQATCDADMIGIRLHNMFVKLGGFSKEKRTREIPVIGFLSNLRVPIIGQIDELLLDRNATRIVDRKTRKSDSMPRVEQTRVTEFQVMTYYELLNRLRTESSDLADVLKFCNLDEQSRMTDGLLAQLEPHQYPVERNIMKLGRMVVHAAKAIPGLSKEFEIIYENQQTKRIIGSHRFQFSEEAWKQDLEFASQYWLGNRPAKPVSEGNRWKCAYCGFKERSICPVWVK